LRTSHTSKFATSVNKNRLTANAPSWQSWKSLWLWGSKNFITLRRFMMINIICYLRITRIWSTFICSQTHSWVFRQLITGPSLNTSIFKPSEKLTRTTVPTSSKWMSSRYSSRKIFTITKHIHLLLKCSATFWSNMKSVFTKRSNLNTMSWWWTVIKRLMITWFLNSILLINIKSEATHSTCCRLRKWIGNIG
jgi:hypothetical protein